MLSSRFFCVRMLVFCIFLPGVFACETKTTGSWDGGEDSPDAAVDAGLDAAADAEISDGWVQDAAGEEGGCIELPDAAVDASVYQDGSMDGAVDADLQDADLQDGDLHDGYLQDADLADGHIETDGCIPDGGVLSCPSDMVMVENLFCIDIYEASRPDATAVSFGTDDSMATSRPNVRPWTTPWVAVNLDIAREACENAGKRLCSHWEWETACKGPEVNVYSYGNTYDPVICNGIDTFCYCDGDECSSVEPCPYPHCYGSPPPGETEPENGCGAALRSMPTGSFPDCTNAYGVYDITGNVWELVDNGDDGEYYRGGAFNCLNSEFLHRCAFIAQGTHINVKGFRCCKDIN